MIWAILIVFLTGLDQFTKYLAAESLRNIYSIPLLSDIFELTYVENRGAAFGVLQGAKWLFIPLTGIITLVICYYNFYVLPGKENKLLHLSLSFITAGAVGNLIDRIRLGYVVDFFYFHIQDIFHWPVFNAADSLVVVGTILLAWCMLFQQEHAIR